MTEPRPRQRAFAGGLTAAQAAVLLAIDGLSIDDFRPTVREVMRAVRGRNVSAVYRHIQALRRKGFVRKAGGRDRGVVVVWVPDDVRAAAAARPAGPKRKRAARPKLPKPTEADRWWTILR